MSEPQSVAGYLAALYGDADDIAFTASGITPLTVDELRDSYAIAVNLNEVDAASALFFEICRLTGAVQTTHYQAIVYGSSAGLWRVH